MHGHAVSAADFVSPDYPKEAVAWSVLIVSRSLGSQDLGHLHLGWKKDNRLMTLLVDKH
jgi:hypothetical protein